MKYITELIHQLKQVQEYLAKEQINLLGDDPKNTDEMIGFFITVSHLGITFTFHKTKELEFRSEHMVKWHDIKHGRLNHLLIDPLRAIRQFDQMVENHLAEQKQGKESSNEDAGGRTSIAEGVEPVTAAPGSEKGIASMENDQ